MKTRRRERVNRNDFHRRFFLICLYHRALLTIILDLEKQQEEKRGAPFPTSRTLFLVSYLSREITLATKFPNAFGICHSDIDDDNKSVYWS